MKNVPFLDDFTARLGRRLRSFTWIWVVVLISILITSSTVWFTVRQQQITDQIGAELALLRQSRLDLMKGYLHVALAGSASSPFDHSQGLTLLDQAQVSLEQALQLQQTISNRGDSGAKDTALSAVTAFAGDVATFREILDHWQGIPEADPALEAEIRISFYALEQHAGEVDYQIQQDLAKLSHRYTRFYAGFLTGAALLLTILCGAVYAGGRARQWAEEALRESEERYRTVADYTYDWEYWRAPDGKILYMSPSCERVTGYSTEEFIANPNLLETIVHPDDHSLLEQHRLLAQQDEGESRVHKVDFRILRRDGQVRWIAHVCQAIYRADGASLGRRATNHDITKRKRTEERMERALRRQAVVNQLALALGTASNLDTVYRTAYECVRDMMDCVAFIVSSYDRETDLIRASYVVTRGTVRDTAGFPPIPLEKEEYGTQSRVIRTGEPLYVPDHQRSMNATETKYKIDEEGNITPGAPPEEEENSTRSALYVPTKIEGQTIGVIQVQSRRLDGYDEEDRNLLSALANVTAIAVQNARLFESLHRSNQELEAQRANLEELIAQRTSALNEQIGETEQLNRALANLLEDIQVANRGLEQATQQLKQANEELESFSYSVSHDLRAPLRAIDGFSRILQDEHAPELSTEAQRYLGLVRDNAQQMGQLIDDLLAFSRLSRRPLDKQSVSPADLARQVLEELAHEYEGRRVEISVAELPTCQADPVLLKQVYINLLFNAIKYTRERETARIEVGTVGIEDVRSQIADLGEDQSEISDPQSAIYFVRDNGVGFDMRYADKLFGVFQRLHRAEDYEGTGVGLAIVQRIVRRHGGRVWAEAEVDKGATFYFTI